MISFSLIQFEDLPVKPFRINKRNKEEGGEGNRQSLNLNVTYITVLLNSRYVETGFDTAYFAVDWSVSKV